MQLISSIAGQTVVRKFPARNSRFRRPLEGVAVEYLVGDRASDMSILNTSFAGKKPSSPMESQRNEPGFPTFHSASLSIQRTNEPKIEDRDSLLCFFEHVNIDGWAWFCVVLLRALFPIQARISSSQNRMTCFPRVYPLSQCPSRAYNTGCSVTYLSEVL